MSNNPPVNYTAATAAQILRDLLAAHERCPDAILAVMAQRGLFAQHAKTIRASHVLAARQLLAHLEAAVELPTLDRTRAKLCMDACQGIPSEWLMGNRFRVNLVGNGFDLAKEP